MTRRAPALVARSRCGIAALGLAVLWLGGGCHAPAPRTPPANLAGLALPLRDGPVVAAVVDGVVGTIPAEIALEVASPLTSVTRGCFPGGPPELRAVVTVALPLGGEGKFGVSDVEGVRLGQVGLGTLRAAVLDGPGCLVTLGSDVLKPYALEIDPETRTLKLGPSRPRAEYEAQLAALSKTREVGLVELSLEPNSDWPMLAARVRQGAHELLGTFLLSSSGAQASVSEEDARRAGLRTEVEVLEAGLPPAVHLPLERFTTAFAPDRLELSPGLALEHARLISIAARRKGLVGVLGGEVWGKFRAVIDPRGGVLLLSRPAVQTSGEVQRCRDPEGAWSEEACFALRSSRREGGVYSTLTLRRSLPEGGRVYLQASQEGKPAGDRCRVAVTLPPSDRGTTVAESLPWKALRDAQPVCAELLSHTTELSFGLFEEGALTACPGACLVVSELNGDRTSCACQPGSVSAETVALQRFRPLLEKLRREAKQPRSAPPAPEPEEPDEE